MKQAKLSELEAEMGDTGEMIAARLTALERPRPPSSPDSMSPKVSVLAV